MGKIFNAVRGYQCDRCKGWFDGKGHKVKITSRAKICDKCKLKGGSKE